MIMKEQELKDALNRIEISDEARERILENSKKISFGREYVFMRSKKKFAFIAVAATFVLSVTAFAVGNKIIISGGSSSIPNYTELPSERQVVKDVGYSGDMVNEFSNGYSFDTGSVISNNVIESDGTAAEKFKSLMLRYDKGDNEVELSIQKYSCDTKQPDVGAVLSAKNGDIDIYAHSSVHKIVPENYVKSAEEIAAEERGELSFAYDGESHIEERNIKSVSWIKDDIRYNLMQIDGELSTEELTDMANELIEQD